MNLLTYLQVHWYLFLLCFNLLYFLIQWFLVKIFYSLVLGLSFSYFYSFWIFPELPHLFIHYIHLFLACIFWFPSVTPWAEGRVRQGVSYPPPPALQGAHQGTGTKPGAHQLAPKADSCSKTDGHLEKRNYTAQVLLLLLANFYCL